MATPKKTWSLVAVGGRLQIHAHYTELYLWGRDIIWKQNQPWRGQFNIHFDLKYTRVFAPTRIRVFGTFCQTQNSSLTQRILEYLFVKI